METYVPLIKSPSAWCWWYFLFCHAEAVGFDIALDD